jgi:hypothetical protein
VPALVLSCDLDPVTPPTWGESVVKSLKNGRHITVPGTGHGVVATACGQKLIRNFLDDASATSLDVSCVRSIKRPPFFVSPAGPDPEHATSPAPGDVQSHAPSSGQGPVPSPGQGPSTTLREPQGGPEPGRGTNTAP